MARPELMITSSDPSEIPLRIWAKLTASSLFASIRDRDLSLSSLLRLAVRTRACRGLRGGGGGDDLPTEAGDATLFLDDLRHVRGRHQLVVLRPNLQVTPERGELQPLERRLDLLRVDALGLLDSREQRLRGDVVLGADVVRVLAELLLVRSRVFLVVAGLLLVHVLDVVVDAERRVAERLEQRFADGVLADARLDLLEEAELVRLLDEGDGVGAHHEHEDSVGATRLEFADLRAEVGGPKRRKQCLGRLLPVLLE